jgi:flagellar motor switch protein FliN
MSSSQTLSSSSELPPAAEPAAALHPFSGLLDVACRVDVVLGTGSITVRDCLKLQRLSVIGLKQLAGSDLEVRVQGVSVVTGEVVIVDDSTAIRVTEVMPPPGARARA